MNDTMHKAFFKEQKKHHIKAVMELIEQRKPSQSAMDTYFKASSINNSSKKGKTPVKTDIELSHRS